MYRNKEIPAKHTYTQMVSLISLGVVFTNHIKFTICERAHPFKNTLSLLDVSV